MTKNYSEEEKFNLLIEVAELTDPTVGPWSYNTWRTLNEKYFDGKLKIGPIYWGLTEHGRPFGYFEGKINRITLHTSLIKPHSDAWGKHGLLSERFAEDVLLHEMIHQHLLQKFGTTRDKKKQSHNCKMWCEEINRLNPLLGLHGKAAVVRQRRIREEGKKGNGDVKWAPDEGCMSRIQIASFPHSLRPSEYYEESCQEMLRRLMKNSNT